MLHRPMLVYLVVLLFALASCQTARTPEERELADLKDELRDVESRIAGEERVATMSGEAPSGELQKLQDEKEDLEYRIRALEETIDRQQQEE